MQNSNPYQAPQALFPRRPLKPGRPVWWLIAFVVNLPMPAFFGVEMAQGTALLGMLIGVFTLAGFGWKFCISYPKFVGSFSAGTLVVAIGQFFPVLQLLAGIVAAEVTSMISPTFEFGEAEGDLWILVTMPDGLLITLLTGGLLAMAAVALGIFFHVVWPGNARKGLRAAETR